MTTTVLHQNPDMIDVMEADLRTKIAVAIDFNPDLKMAVHGVFSIDDLEAKMESDLGNCIAIGVQYSGGQRHVTDRADLHSGTFNSSRGNAARIVQYLFVVVLGVPCNEICDERKNATKILTLLRNSVIGKPIAEDKLQRTWDFVKEQPELGASTPTMLYYSQLWQLAMPVIGN